MKKDKQPAPKPILVKQESVFIYTSTCCQSAATKDACVMPRGKGVGGYLGAKPEGEATLGTWRCTACRRPAKVSRSVNPEAKPKARNIIGR